MPFRPRTVEEIEQAMHLRLQGRSIALTDLVVASVLRIIAREMVAEEYASQWAGVGAELNQWFLQTAKAGNLDRRLADFGLTRRPAEAASGHITVTADGSGATVPAGHQVQTKVTDPAVPVKRYRVAANPDTASGSWSVPTNGTAKIRIVATTAGAAGNTAANTITDLGGQITGVTGITNELALTSGLDEASDAEFREAFIEHLAGLTRGTRGALITAIRDYVDPETGTRPIRSVGLEEWDGVSPIEGSLALRVWIDDGTGNTPSALVEAIQRLIDGADTETDDGLRPAGVPTVVQPATAINVHVDAAVDIRRDVSADDVQREVEETIRRFIGGIPVSGTRITGETQGRLVIAQLFKAVMNVEGVLRAVFARPTADVVVPPGKKVVPGNVDVSVTSVT